ncbi:NADH-quinone oxidoreductase subunit NuoG [Nitrospira sp. BLG_1]|uniref:NADH-quinone oxidoreductase subunit NuoG n=1 Tax=Nitrospira sp. BLG_1 TaxID=3395883 RepID=UPI0039BC3226
MAIIIVDNKSYTVDEKQNLLAACLGHGLNVPYFCWHPAMGSVGACRQCAVKQFKDDRDQSGRLVMSCMTPATNGTRISIDDPEAKAFRASVIEWLMVNHPHDCPVCDEGGECHLQDMTVMTGHVYRRSRFPKRTHRNQDLGPFIRHEMNRCIQCYRCVRYYRDYAGGRDLNVFGAHDALYFGREQDGTLENEFSGNLVEVCPTGVFTDKTFFHHYTRKWDLQSAQSICPHCSLGCNTTAGERYGTLRRITNRFNSQVNGYFLCDRGRFGYEYVNSDHRIKHPRVKAGSDRTQPGMPESAPKTLEFAADRLRQARGIVGIGSPRASLEANVALQSLVGPQQFYQGIDEQERQLLSMILNILRTGPVSSASIHDAEQADAVLVLGPDLLNEAPRLALALLQSIRQQPMERVDELKISQWDEAAIRNAVQNRRGPLFLAGSRRTWFHAYATESYLAAPDDLARLGFAVAGTIGQGAPSVPDLSQDVKDLAQRIAESLTHAQRPLIIAGTGSGSQATIEAAANVAWALHQQGKQPRLSFVLPEANSAGLALLGGGSLRDAFDSISQGKADTVIVLENDLYRRADQATVDAFLRKARTVIVIDSLEHRTAAHADILLPAATGPESDGTFVNNEGRAQRFYQVYIPQGEVIESWRWLKDLARAQSQQADVGTGIAAWNSFDDAVSATATAAPELARVGEVAPSASFRLVGQKLPRQSERYSGRTSLLSHLTMHEPPPPVDQDSPLGFTMEGYRGPLPSPLISQFWAPGWNSIQAVNTYQDEVGGPLRDEMPGVRLIEPVATKTPAWFTSIPRAFQPADRQWLLLPLSAVFGSDELSNRSPAIAERIVRPFLSVHPSDGARVGLDDHSTIDLAWQGTTYSLAVHFESSTPVGTVGLSLVPEVCGVRLPAWIDLFEAIKSERKRRAA